MKPKAIFLGFRAAWALVPRLPEGVAIRLFDVLADLMWLRNGRGVRRLQGNLSHVTARPFHDPHLRALTRQALRSYSRYWREMFTLGTWSHDEVCRRLRVVGREHMDGAIAVGSGAIIAAPHMGNWDIAAVWASREGFPVTTVAERLEPVQLFDAFVATRGRYGLEVLPHRGGERPALEVLRERLHDGRIVALVSDRDLSRRGIEVEFFGATARMAAGPAVLALATRAPILPTFLWNAEDAAVLEVGPPLPIYPDDDVAAVTQRLADHYAASIAAHPADWHMLQRVWVDDEATR